MYPFYDENYSMHQFMYPSNMSYPYLQPAQAASPLQRLKGSFNLQGMIAGTQKTVSTVNQIIPIVHQVRPIVGNAKNAFQVLKVMRTVDDFDFDDIEKSITPNDIDDSIEDAVIIEDNTSTQVEDIKGEKLFENML